jgi:hypothetical protein
MSDGQWIERGTLDLWEEGHREQISRIAEMEARLAEVEAALKLHQDLDAINVAEVARLTDQLATARRDAWNRAAMVAEAWIARKENLISLPDTIRALIAQEDAAQDRGAEE